MASVVCLAILSMIQALGLRVVAKGVENSEQASFLLERGCIQVRGCLFGAALSGGGFSDFCSVRGTDAPWWANRLGEGVWPITSSVWRPKNTG
jgi:EAL domain-containing protein (putative c-di-GMP-specific phosphodiesterase class I)